MTKCECCGEQITDDREAIKVYRPDTWDEIRSLSAMGRSGHPTDTWCDLCVEERIAPRDEWDDCVEIAA